MKKLAKSFFAALSVIAVISFIGCPEAPEVPEPSTIDIESVVDSATEGSTIDLSSTTVDSLTGSISQAVTISGGSSTYDMGGAVLTIKAAGVILRNLSNLDVVVDEAVGDGDFTLENCTVNNFTVDGGGSNSIHVSESTVTTVIVEKDEVRIVLESGATVTNITLNSNATLEATDATSTYTTVTVANDNEVTIAATVTTISVDEGTVTLTSVTKSDGTTVSAKVTTIEATSSSTVAVTSNNVSVKTVTPKDDSTSITVITTDDVTDADLPTENVSKEVFKYVSEETDPIKTSYTVGDAFDSTGFTAKVVFSINGIETTKSINSDDVTFSGFDSSVAGLYIVSIVYSGVTISKFECAVSADLTKQRIPTKDITSEADFIKCINDSVNEYMAYIYANYITESRTAATTSEDAIKQINDFIAESFKNVGNIMNFIQSGTFTDDVAFDKEIDLENIDVDEAVETFTSVFASVCKTYLDKDISSDDVISFIIDDSEHEAMFEKYKAALQASDCNVDKLYLHPGLTVNKDVTGSDTFISTSDSLELTLSADANKLIKNITGVSTNKDVDMAYLPVSTFSGSISSSVGASVTAENYAKLFDGSLVSTTTTKPADDDMIIGGSTESYYNETTGEITKTTTYEIFDYKAFDECISDYSASIEAYLQALVCTSDGLGGNLKAQMNVKVEDGDISGLLKSYSEIINKYSNTEPDSEGVINDLLTMSDDYISITLSSTNTSGTQTWSNTYTCTSLYNLVKSLLED